MKNKFDIFNNIEMDFSEYEECPFNSDEKDNILSSLKSKMKKKSKNNKGLIAAVTSIALMGTLALTNTSVIANINIASQNIKEYLHLDNSISIDANTTSLNKTIYDKNVGVTLNEVFLDGGQIIINSSIDFNNFKYNDKDKKLSDYNLYSHADIEINGEPVIAGWVDNQFIDKNIATYTTGMHFDESILDSEENTIAISIKFENLKLIEENKSIPIKGNWNFNLNMDKEAILNSTKTIIPSSKTLITKGNTINISNISLSPLSVKVYFESITLNNLTDPGFKIIDEFGNDLFLKTALKNNDNTGMIEFRLIEKSSKFKIINTSTNEEIPIEFM